MTPFVDALIASPIGASLLEELERRTHPRVNWESPKMPNDAMIAAAAEHVATMDLGELLEAALRAADYVGPWIPDGKVAAEVAYRHVFERQPIAEAISQRFAASLHSSIDLDAQEWWISEPSQRLLSDITPAFTDLTYTYGSGEFPWNGVRTITSPPARIHEDLSDYWEMHATIGRWDLHIQPNAIEALPVFTIHRPQDWADLVSAHPLHATPRQGCWGLPDNQSEISSNSPLFEIDHQHAAITSCDQHLVPDWTSVATEYSGVHLSWAGWMTSEGYAHLDEHGTATMLRYWFSDYTFWLTDVFGEPTRLGPPSIEQFVDPDHEQAERDYLRGLLGR